MAMLLMSSKVSLGDAKVMEILCPNSNAHGREPTVMELKGYSWSYKNGKPAKMLYQFKCPKCDAILRTELPVIYFRGGKK